MVINDLNNSKGRDKGPQQEVGISKLKCVVRVIGIPSERRIHFCSSFASVTV